MDFASRSNNKGQELTFNTFYSGYREPDEQISVTL